MYTNERMAEWIATVINQHCLGQDQQLNIERARCLVLACLQQKSEGTEAVRNEEIMSTVR